MASKADCTYTGCFCEENTFLLCERLLGRPDRASAGSDGVEQAVAALKGRRVVRCWAVWVSNPSKKVAVWRQGAMNEGGGEEDDEGLAVWDYHVFCAATLGPDEQGGEETTVILDLDSTLPFPSRAEEYIQGAFKPHDPINEQFRPTFRLVAGEDFLESFSSDRSHMLRPDGGYNAPPPTYSPIISKGGAKTNVMAFADVADRKIPGAILALGELLPAMLSSAS